MDDQMATVSTHLRDEFYRRFSEIAERIERVEQYDNTDQVRQMRQWVEDRMNAMAKQVQDVVELQREQIAALQPNTDRGREFGVQAIAADDGGAVGRALAEIAGLAEHFTCTQAEIASRFADHEAHLVELQKSCAANTEDLANQKEHIAGLHPDPNRDFREVSVTAGNSCEPGSAVLNEIRELAEQFNSTHSQVAERLAEHKQCLDELEKRCAAMAKALMDQNEQIAAWQRSHDSQSDDGAQLSEEMKMPEAGTVPITEFAAFVEQVTNTNEEVAVRLEDQERYLNELEKRCVATSSALSDLLRRASEGPCRARSKEDAGLCQTALSLGLKEDDYDSICVSRDILSLRADLVRGAWGRLGQARAPKSETPKGLWIPQRRLVERSQSFKQGGPEPHLEEETESEPPGVRRKSFA